MPWLKPSHISKYKKPNWHKLHPVQISFILIFPLNYLVLTGNPFLEMGNKEKLWRLIFFFLESKRSKKSSSQQVAVKEQDEKTLGKFSREKCHFSTISRAPSFSTWVLCPALIDYPHPHHQLYQESDKQGLTRCHQSLSLRGEWKESNICSRKCLLLLLLFTGTQSLQAASHFLIALQWKCMTSRGQKHPKHHSFPCVSIFTIHSSHTPQAPVKQGCTQLATDNPDHSQWNGWWFKQCCARARRDGGRERLHHTGSRWYSL